MSTENVLSLNAFGEIIEPKSKRQYTQEDPKNNTEIIQDIIPLKKINPPEDKEQEISVSNNTSNGTNKIKVEGRYARGSRQTNCVTYNILMQISQIKLLHWQTESLSEHKSLDDIFNDLVNLGDELVESVMGKYGRPQLSGEEATFNLSNYEDPNKPDGLPRFIAQIDNCFRKECASLFSEDNDPEIYNIIQEILGKIDKLSYLLTLNK